MIIQQATIKGYVVLAGDVLLAMQMLVILRTDVMMMIDDNFSFDNRHRRILITLP
jgi:hypothetical protein